MIRSLPESVGTRTDGIIRCMGELQSVAHWAQAGGNGAPVVEPIGEALAAILRNRCPIFPRVSTVRMMDRRRWRSTLVGHGYKK